MEKPVSGLHRRFPEVMGRAEKPTSSGPPVLGRSHPPIENSRLAPSQIGPSDDYGEKMRGI